MSKVQVTTGMYFLYHVCLYIKIFLFYPTRTRCSPKVESDPRVGHNPSPTRTRSSPSAGLLVVEFTKPPPSEGIGKRNGAGVCIEAAAG